MDATSTVAPIGIIETDTEGIVTAVNDAAEALLATSASTLRNQSLPRVFPDATTDALSDAFSGETTDETAFREYYPTIDRWLRVEVRPTTEGAAVFLRSRESRHDLQTQVDRLERQVDRVETIDNLIADILRQIVDAPEYDAVATTICERLAATDRYAFVWVGERVGTTDQLRSVAIDGTVDDLAEIVDTEFAEPMLPAHRAMRADEPHTTNELVADDTIPRAVRLAAFRAGLQSSLAVPIHHDGITYGTISIYVSDEGGIEARERAAIETLGIVAGFAIVSGRQEELLFADTVTELTIEVADDASPGVAATTDTLESLSLVGVVPVEDAGVVGYLRPSSTAPSASDRLEKHPRTDRTRIVRRDEDPLIELVTEQGTPLSVVTAWGASINSATYRDGTARLTATVSTTETPRQLVEVLEARFDTVELAAKQRRSRDPDPTNAFRDTLRNALTDRQRQVLRTAYLSEYFTSPRGSTAEEVAETLGITAPTLLYHLRKAQRALASAFFKTHTDVDTLDG